MTLRLTALPPATGKWCAYALLLFMPGSFILLPALWLVRYVGDQLAHK
jgi:hypothetical protein